MSFGRTYRYIVILAVLGAECSAQGVTSPGVFARMGSGARAMGLGNAMAAVRTGELSGFYNPAAVPFTDGRTLSASYGFLSLDRHLNALTYSQPIDTNAGIAFGVLNSGVSKIDGRDKDGFHTEEYSTSENLFTLSFGLKIRRIVVGMSPKLYYNVLFDKFSATAFGFDFGVLYPATPDLTLGFVLRDFGAKYKWDSSVLYAEQGNSTTEPFLERKILAASYRYEELGMITAEVESNPQGAFGRVGIEITPVASVTFRGGIDGWKFKEPDQAHPTFGVSFDPGVKELSPVITYAMVVEPYGLFTMHVLSLAVRL